MRGVSRLLLGIPVLLAACVTWGPKFSDHPASTAAFNCRVVEGGLTYGVPIERVGLWLGNFLRTSDTNRRRKLAQYWYMVRQISKPMGTRLFAVLVTLAFAGIAILWGPETLGQELHQAEALERMARILTDRDPQVRSAELWGLAPLPGGPESRVRFLYQYTSPEQYLLLLALDTEGATFFASDARTTIIYDPLVGRMRILTGMIPTLYMGLHENNLEFSWGVRENPSNQSSDPASGLDRNLLLDIPAFLQSRNITRREVDSTREGVERLVLTAVNGDRMVFAVDPMAAFQFAEMQIEDANGRKRFEVRVNQSLMTVPHLPDIGAIQKVFKVEKVITTRGLGEIVRLVPDLLLPIAALSTSDDPFRELVDKSMGKKQNWGQIAEQVKRDLPKLRRLLPAPPPL